MASSLSRFTINVHFVLVIFEKSLDVEVKMFPPSNVFLLLYTTILCIERELHVLSDIAKAVSTRVLLLCYDVTCIPVGEVVSMFKDACPSNLWSLNSCDTSSTISLRPA